MKLSFMYVLCCVKYIQTQYLPNKPAVSPCDTNKSVLVERFFNMIFTEFHNSPPVCVCVQMCEGQSTYCYPNGCLKREDKKRAALPVSLIENAQSSIFLVDQKNEVPKDLSTTYESSDLVTKTEAISEKQMNIRPDPFKDKYKSLFRYKKMPKVELRYNLREQVKNTKSDVLKSGSVDVSNTRWPQTKHSKLNGYTMLSDAQEIQPISKQKKFFIASLPEKDLVVYPIRYFKRDLTNIVDTKLNTSINLPKEVINSTFSLENLIDNIIENNFVANSSVTNQTKLDESNKTTNETEYFNETNIVLINSTDENLDNSKYTKAINYTNIFNELIAKLSKKIEKRNNTSMEIMKKFTNNIVVGDDLSNEIEEKAVTAVDITTLETTTESTIEPITTLLPTTETSHTTEAQLSNTIPNDTEDKTMKTDRQRFATKLPSKDTN